RHRGGLGRRALDRASRDGGRGVGRRLDDRAVRPLPLTSRSHVRGAAPLRLAGAVRRSCRTQPLNVLPRTAAVAHPLARSVPSRTRAFSSSSALREIWRCTSCCLLSTTSPRPVTFPSRLRCSARL